MSKPGRPLVVLDLNGTLLDAAKRLLREPQGRPLPFLAKTRSKYIYLRPGALGFLKWLLDHFDVGIWTSCIERNAHAIVEAAIPADMRRRFRFVYHRGHCDLVAGPGFPSVKDLTKVWQRFPEYGATNTWAVDDTRSKYQKQPENLVLINEFKADAPHAATDKELVRLQQHLTTLL